MFTLKLNFCGWPSSLELRRNATGIVLVWKLAKSRLILISLRIPQLKVYIDILAIESVL